MLKPRYIRYLSNPTSNPTSGVVEIMGLNSQHRRDPHREEDRMECSFDLKCHQLTKIIDNGVSMGGTLKRLSTLKKLKHFGGLKRPGVGGKAELFKQTKKQ